ncbi:DUF1349 domain-containing protein [Arthrobacter sp. ISL-48]|uniref:DUF1349 domain-containing protein n=1 Tax=Arthrobacter sp. ISL-48 TaxID=2819110 RepID=UPI001BE63B36|nr:DUF1349 domain-containing protein [Arthrobacter sp. ISL-48]MBT2533974.1 DUF1349 domain-containing protein [Arthrobacter sp. ISL-48]
MHSDMQWINEPKNWRMKGEVLHVETGQGTDFWRKTFYGFTRDTGHFYFRTVSGDFTATVTIGGNISSLYDQCGLMVRASDTTWIKTGAEFADGVVNLSTVITNGFSDWSVLPLAAVPQEVTIRLTRHGEAIRVQYLDGEGIWQLLRLGYLDLSESCQVGVMSCAPERAGFEATFRDFQISDPISRDLHD